MGTKSIELTNRKTLLTFKKNAMDQYNMIKSTPSNKLIAAKALTKIALVMAAIVGTYFTLGGYAAFVLTTAISLASKNAQEQQRLANNAAHTPLTNQAQTQTP